MSWGNPFEVLHACDTETIGLKNAHLDLEVGAGSTGPNPTENTTDHYSRPASNQGNQPNDPDETHARVLIFGSRKLRWGELGFGRYSDARVMDLKWNIDYMGYIHCWGKRGI
jgi:hypothetical protein